MSNAVTRDMCQTKIYTSKDREAFEDEFDRLLGRLIRHSAKFDFNVGLQLNWMSEYYGFKLGDLLNPKKTPLQKRVAKLKSVCKKIYQPAGAVAMVEFADWFTKIDKARALRNDYAHGRWGIPGGHRGGPDTPSRDCELLLGFVPLHWNLSPETMPQEITMTLGEFEQQVEDAISLFVQYFDLEKKYLSYMRLGANGLG